MPQPSISYACGRVGVLKRSQLGQAQIERLLAAPQPAEAERALVDIGFMAADQTDYQAAADLHINKACKLIKAVTTDTAMTDCFFYRYDVHNLKVLIKSRHLAHAPEFLSACGSIDVETLKHCVADRTYVQLPPELAEGLKKLEKRIAVEFDPLLIDAELDKAMYRQIFQNLKGRESTLAYRYFEAKADLQNLIMLLRVRDMDKESAFFAALALDGGKAGKQNFVRAFADNDQLVRMVGVYGMKVKQAAQAATLDSKKLPYLEKVADDYLYGLFKPYRYEAASVEVLLAYLLLRQREAADVRLIMTGKINGFSNEDVQERVRELNG
ncbi:MAG TPA: V-type ATPase subunit [Candidatus Limiplasma sp.]|nr:V-type ATPase subunit [Candidatus Limiplasma sp.]